MRKKFGFTLAEVLITLGIIGIIAAMTVPNLVNKYQKNMTVSKVQKAYANINVMAKNIQLNSGCDDVECLGWAPESPNAPEEKKLVTEEFVRLAGLKNAKVYEHPTYFRVAPIYKPKDPDGLFIQNLIVTPAGFTYKITPYEYSYNNILFKNIIVGVGTDFKVGPKGLNDPKTIYQYTAGRNFFYFVIYEDFKVSPAILISYTGNVYSLEHLLLNYGKNNISRDTLTPYEEAKKHCIPSIHESTLRGLPQGHSCAALMLLDGWKMNY